MPPSALNADHIRQAFDKAGLPLDPSCAQRLADEIACYGSLDRTIAALSNDDVLGPLKDALALRQIRSERADPALKIARLLQEARDLDARAAPSWAEAAQFHGSGQFRRNQGDHDLADQFLARARAAERWAAALEDKALDLRLQAADLQTGQALRTALRDMAA